MSSEKKINGLVNKSYYDKKKAHDYYENNKEKIKSRSNKKWTDMSEEEKKVYYEERKIKRLKKRLKGRMF